MTEELTLDEKLNAEVDLLPWSALVRHFAFGRVYLVRQPWTLIEAAKVMNGDDAEALKAAMQANHFGIPDDEEVKSWIPHDQQFQVLVISPFVLIQPVA